MDINIAQILLNKEFIITLLLGCLSSSFIGGLVITPIMYKIFSNASCKSQKETHKYAFWIGIIERSFYTICVCFGSYIMVGGYLVLKSFQNIDAEKRDAISFHAYLLGNSLSLLIGVIAGYCVKLIIIRNLYICI